MRCSTIICLIVIPTRGILVAKGLIRIVVVVGRSRGADLSILHSDLALASKNLVSFDYILTGIRCIGCIILACNDNYFSIH
jgi:hypothetical protein